MGSMMAFVGEQRGTQSSNTALKAAIYKSVRQLSHRSVKNEYRG